MEKRVTRIYVIILLIGGLYAVFAMFSFRSSIVDTTVDDEGVSILDKQMQMTQEGNTYYYRGILPLKNTNEKSIVYNTVHMYLEVFIDGNKVYELKAEKGKAVKTTGFCWNVISLTEDDAGKEIVLKVTPVYKDSKPNADFFYGSYRKIEHRILAEHIFQLFLACIITLVGIIMLFYALFVVKKGQDAKIMMHFSIFAIMLGIWDIGETQILDWIFPCSIVLVFVSHLVLMAMPVPFVLFLRNMYHDRKSKLWAFCCYVNCVVMAVRVALQVAGIYDLRETLLLTHLYLLLFVLCIVVMTVQEVMKNELTRQVKINGICIIVILASTLSELIIYRLKNKSTPLGSIGFLFYIMVMGTEIVRKSHELIEQARENALYRQLAFTDELTRLSNRTAFRADLETRMKLNKATGKEEILPTVIFMFDLNDLKKCNDTYGHDYGDQYIKMAADVLKKIFAQDGKCYRIGGDEFCAWAPYTSLDEINRKLSLLEQDVQELNEKGFVVVFSIAVGYAIYEENEDGSGLHSTMKRADKMMYERKQQYKQSRRISGTMP